MVPTGFTSHLVGLGAHNLVGYRLCELPDQLLHVGRAVPEPGQELGATCAVSGVSGRLCIVVVVPSSNPICRYLRF